MMQLANRVAETTTTDGYSNLTLKGATFGHRRFVDAFTPYTAFPYCIVHQTQGQWEIGKGHLSPGGLLIRDEIIDSSLSNTAPAMINLLAGEKDVFLPLPVGFGLDTIVTVGSASLTFVNGILTGTADLVS